MMRAVFSQQMAKLGGSVCPCGTVLGPPVRATVLLSLSRVFLTQFLLLPERGAADRAAYHRGGALSQAGGQDRKQEVSRLAPPRGSERRSAPGRPRRPWRLPAALGAPGLQTHQSLCPASRCLSLCPKCPLDEDTGPWIRTHPDPI